MLFTNPKLTLAPYTAFLAIFAILFTAFAPAASAQKFNRAVPTTEILTPGADKEEGDTKAETVEPEACTGGNISFTTSGNPTGGYFGNIRTYSGAGGVSVRASAFGRLKTSPFTWETGYVGQFGSAGLGVEDRVEGSGDPNHRVDNVGTRYNYLLLEFNQLVDVNSINFQSIHIDGDFTYWIGTTNNPYTNHLTLSDALLGTFGPQVDQDNGTTAGSVAINPGNKVGNVLVIAARVGGTDLDDYFKVAGVNVSCAPQNATVTIIKQVETLDNSDRSTQSFNFTTTGPMSSFSLVDNNDGIANGGPDQTTQTITDFTQLITVTEVVPASWTLLDIDCDTTGPAEATIDFARGKVTIKADAGSSTTCTYVNGLNIPSAARTSISGRAMLANGKGASNAVLSLFDLTTGETRTVRTNTFGYYMFDEVEVEKFYVLTISHSRYSFEQSTRQFTLMDQIADMNFTQAF